ncbi:hypothetical protein RND81_13G199400 [Saponaria officinalis]|uniref:Cyclin-dependent kinase inhibitor domain-containing protein n=1 Tax=Saponaria officinalis TaxID=3572 RepID=A0AAW1H4E4_SAPOF
MRRYAGNYKEEEIIKAKIRTRGMKMAAATTPYHVYDLRSRRRSRRRRRNIAVSSPASYRIETTTFEDANNCTSSSVGSGEVIVCSGGLELEFPPSSSCFSSNVVTASFCSNDLLNKCVSITSGIEPDLEVESGGEASSKFVECNKQISFNSLSPHIISMDISENSSAFETKKLEQSETKGLDYASVKSTVEIKPIMTPSEYEIEEFFSSAEKQLQKRFSDKYNFDIVKDVPLEGRYEWCQIKP